MTATPSAVRMAPSAYVTCYDDSDITPPPGGHGRSGFGGHDQGLAAVDRYRHTMSNWIAL